MNRWVGKFPSIKLDRMVGYQSHIERDLIYLLDFDLAVTTYCEQPFSIHYKAENKTRRYTPDFCVTHGTGTYLVECKHHDFLQPEVNRPKWQAARQWCTAQGARFVVVTDQVIRAGYLLENVKMLTDHARYPVDEATIVALLHAVDAIPSLTIADLMRTVAPEQPQAIMPAILNLVYRGFLSLSLAEAPITVASPVWAAHRPVGQTLLPATLFA